MAQNKRIEQSGKGSLAEAYRAAGSEFDRRAIAIRAIDENALRTGTTAASVDEIFGTTFSHLSTKPQDRKRSGVIHFLSEDLSVKNEPLGEARAYGGWHLVVEFDSVGTVVNYYLTNLTKQMSSVVDTKETYSLQDLQRMYRAAVTAEDRRRICLQAIDSSVIATSEQISVIDQLFGTHFADKLPSRSQVERTAQVSFGPGNNSPQSNSPAAKWFMTTTYDDNGDIRNYYLSNLAR